MRLNLGLDPIFRFECRMSSRRWQHFAGRVCFIGMLLAVLGFVVWGIQQEAHGPSSRNAMVMAGEVFYTAIMITQLSLLLLVAPAVAADAICLDKARGALLPLLTTELSSYEIVMGKFFARCLPIFSYVFCGLPVLGICLLMGGIHPEVVFEAYLVCSGVAIVGGAGALLLSVWCTKTYEVLLVCYLAWILFLLAWPITAVMPAGFTAWLQHWSLVDFLQFSNPYYLCLAPYQDPGAVSTFAFLRFLAGCVLVSALFVCAAMRTTARRPRQGHNASQASLVAVVCGASFAGLRSMAIRALREWSRRRPSAGWASGVYALAALAGVGFSFMQLSRQNHMFSSGIERFHQ